jgi:hypothetical protein
MTRMDLFGTVHKGLRAALYGAAAQVARTDFADDAETRGAVGATRALLELLEEHSRHEDAVIMPELARLCPVLHSELRDDHVRVDGLHRDTAALLERLASSAGAERASLGRRLHERLGALVAEHLRHMAREETEANRLLQANHDDAALAAMHGRILASIPPARMAEWLRVIVPSLSRPERVQVLGGLRAAVPPAAFAELTAAARAALGAEAWDATAIAAGP